MNSVNLSWILILEAVLPFIVVSVLLLIVILAGRKKMKQAARSLILNVKANQDKEKQAILVFLSSKLGVSEKNAKKKAKKILNERKFLVRNLVSGILDKNIQAISQLEQDLSRVSNCYHQLEVKATTEETEEKEEEQLRSKEAQETETSLKSEIKGLKQEVHVTLTTLNNIFKEFSSMFGEDDIPEGEMSVDQIITAMESFSGKNATSPASPNAATKPPPVEPVAPQETQPLSTADTPVVTTPEPSQQPEKLTKEAEELDFAVDGAIDDIDNALDGLELGESDPSSTSDEPDWGDAFAESGDKMEEDNN